MAKPIKTDLWIGTSTRFFKWGTFPSKAAAKKYVDDCRLTCYKEYRPAKIDKAP